MKIRTEIHKEAFKYDPTLGFVEVYVYVDEEVVNITRIVSGPMTDIDQFVAGEINLQALRKRWNGMKFNFRNGNKDI